MSITMTWFSGKVYHISNVGDCFLVEDNNGMDIGRFSVLMRAIEYVASYDRVNGAN